MISALSQAWSRNHNIFKFHQLFQKLLVIEGGGGGGGLSTSSFSSVKLCVMINFRIRHDVLCFSCVVVLYSMYSFYAIIKVVFMKETVMCNKRT